MYEQYGMFGGWQNERLVNWGIEFKISKRQYASEK